MAVQETTGLAGTSRTSFFGRLKTDFMPVWDDHVHSKTVVAEVIAKKKGVMGGYESLGSVLTNFPQSAGIAKFEGATLPTAYGSSYMQPILHARDIYGVLEWTGNVERAARKGDKYAWARPRQEDIDRADKQFRLNFARMLYLGPYQIMGTQNGALAGSVATLHGRDSRTSAAADLWKFGAHYMRVNMEVDTVDTASITGSAQAGAALRITAIDKSTPSAPTITLSATTGTPGDGDYYIPFDSRRTSPSTTISNYAGPNGLMQVVDDGSIYTTLYDLARTGTSNPTLRGLRGTNGGSLRAFTEDLIVLQMDRVADEGTGDECDTILADRSARREYIKESKGDRRFEPVQTEKGFSKLMFNSGGTLLPFKVDRDCPPGIMFLLESGGFGWLEQSAMGPIDDQAERFVGNKDAHQIITHKSGNMKTMAPYNNATIEDIIYDVDAATA